MDYGERVALEAALEAAEMGTLALVETAAGDQYVVERVPGGWHLEGDVVVTSGDVAGGDPRGVHFLDLTGEYLSPEAAIRRARAALADGGLDGCTAALAEMDDLASVGWPEAA